MAARGGKMYDIDTYKNNIIALGATGRDRAANALIRDIKRLAPNNPAYKPVIIDGQTRYVIVNTQNNYQIKEIVSMPGEFISLGSIVTFANHPWLVENVNVDDDVYTKAMMYLCNCVMRWKDKNGTIHTYYGVAEDATKYSEGVESTRYIRVGEFQLKVKIQVDSISSAIYRDMRFIIDADKYVPDLVANDDRPYVFRVTRRNITTGTIDDDGYVEITLVQDHWVEGRDDYENMLAAQPWELSEPYISEDDGSGDDGNDDNNEDEGWL